MKKPRDLVITALPAPVRKWVQAQAGELGLDAATWVRMQLVLMSKGQRPLVELDAGPPPAVAETALDAIVGAKLADVEGLGPDLERDQSQDAPPSGDVRPLRRPPTPFSVATQPKHLAGLG